MGTAGRGRDLRRHGVLAALRPPEEDLLPDLLPPGSQVVLVEPRRIRDRAVQLLDEEAALAETLALTWGVADGLARTRSPASTSPSSGSCSTARPGVLAVPSAPEGPGTPALTVRGFSPGRRATRPAWRPRCRSWSGTGYAVTLCAATTAGAARLSTVLAEEGVHAPVVERAQPEHRVPSW